MALRLFYVLFLSSVVIFSQNVTIKGIAPAHKGKEIAIYLFDDLITRSQTLQSSDTVDARGNFQLQLSVLYPQLALIKVDNLYGKIYLQPNFLYGIIFPAKDTSRLSSDAGGQNVDIIINGDSTELNARIIDFNAQFGFFWEKNYKLVVANRIHHELDSFQLKMNKRYENVKLAYFKTYIEYTFALMNENTGRHHNYLAQRYLVNKPVAYNNYEYMEFFSQYFNKYLQRQSVGKNGTFILEAINEQGDYRHLEELMKENPVLKNDTLRELVLIKSLYDLYYTPSFRRPKIKQMLEQLYANASIAEHKKILGNILRNINNLQNGQSAPEWVAFNAKHESIKLSDFKRRYIYLNFFSAKETECLQQMKKEEQLYRKYSDKVVFVSVCMDEDSVLYRNFLKQNPSYKWTILYAGKNKQLMSIYNIKNMPLYYFINMEGYLMQSPALKPDEGIEFYFNRLFKVKEKKNRIGS